MRRSQIRLHLSDTRVGQLHPFQTRRGNAADHLIAQNTASWLAAARALGRRPALAAGIEKLGPHVLTQRVTDWLRTRIVRPIQNTSATQWYRQMEAWELHKFASSLGLSPEECELFERAGEGEDLLVAAGQRVWVNVHGHTSPHEFDVFNADRDEGAVDNSLDRKSGRAAPAAA